MILRCVARCRCSVKDAQEKVVGLLISSANSLKEC